MFSDWLIDLIVMYTVGGSSFRDEHVESNNKYFNRWRSRLVYESKDAPLMQEALSHEGLRAQVKELFALDIQREQGSNPKYPPGPQFLVEWI